MCEKHPNYAQIRDLFAKWVVDKTAYLVTPPLVDSLPCPVLTGADLAFLLAIGAGYPRLPASSRFAANVFCGYAYPMGIAGVNGVRLLVLESVLVVPGVTLVRTLVPAGLALHCKL